MDIRSEVYNALAEITQRTGADACDMEAAFEWFAAHFYEDQEEPEEE